MKIAKWLKWIVLATGVALFALLGFAYYCLADEYYVLRRNRDFEFVRRMLDYDEGEEFQCLGIRNYLNDDPRKSYSCISLPDGQTVFMPCLVQAGDNMYGGYKDGYYYAAKPMNGDWQIRRQHENALLRTGMPPRAKSADSFAQGFDDFLERYLGEVRGIFNDKNLASYFEPEGGGFYMLTTRECKSEYRVVYTDQRTFFSYRAECFRYTGGAHGGTVVKVGTIDVRTGKRLTTADVIPEGKRAEAIARVRAAVIAKIGGEMNLLPTANEVLASLSENFYVGKDGLHFVFAEYSVAPYHYAPELYGPVEVVIPGYGMSR